MRRWTDPTPNGMRILENGTGAWFWDFDTQLVRFVPHRGTPPTAGLYLTDGKNTWKYAYQHALQAETEKAARA